MNHYTEEMRKKFNSLAAVAKQMKNRQSAQEIIDLCGQ